MQKEYLETMVFLETLASSAKWEALFTDEDEKEKKVELPKPSRFKAL